MIRLPQSVAYRYVFKAYLASDHFSAATGKTIAIVISKNGGAFANPSAGATNATEISNGWYFVDLSTTDTGTTGPLVVRGTAATIDDAERQMEVANAFNAGFTGVPGVAAEGAGGLYTRGTGAGQINQAANGMIDTNPVRLNNVSQSLLDLKDFADDGYDPSTNKVQGVVLTDTLTTYTGNTPQTGDSFARIGAAGAGLTALGDTRIANLDATVSSRLAPAGTLATVTNLTNAPSAGDFTSTMKTSLNAATPAVTVSDKTGFSLVAGYDPAKTAAQAGDAMALTSGERTTLAGVIWANATRTLSSFGTLVADVVTAVWAAVTRSLTDKANFTLTADYDAAKTAGDATAANQATINANVGTRLAAAAYTTPPTVGQIADQVWDELLAGHLGAGSTGEALNDAVSGSAPTAAENADALLERNLAGGSDGGRTVRDALRPARNRVSIAGSTMTVYEEDDTTPAWTGALTTNPAAEPITAVDPA